MDKKELKKALDSNREFMNKLGSALAECQNTQFTPWTEQPCKGPCGEFEVYTVNLSCALNIAYLLEADPSSLLSEPGFYVPIQGGERTYIPNESIPMMNSKGVCVGFIYDNKVFEFKNNADLRGFYLVGQPPIYKNSSYFLWDDIENKKKNPFSWALNKALTDLGESFIKFGENPIENNPLTAIAQLVKAIPSITINGTLEYLSQLDRHDAYYVSASLVLATILSGKADQIFLKIKGAG